MVQTASDHQGLVCKQRMAMLKENMRILPTAPKTQYKFDDGLLADRPDRRQGQARRIAVRSESLRQ